MFKVCWQWYVSIADDFFGLHPPILYVKGELLHLEIGLFPSSDAQVVSNSYSFVPKVEVLSNPESGFV